MNTTPSENSIPDRRARKAAAHRRWRNAHKEHLNSYARRWRAAHLAQYRKSRAEYYARNAERIRAQRAADRVRLARAANLAKWLMAPGASTYFGDSFEVKLACLARVVSGNGSFAELARRFGVTRGAIGNHARRAREAFGLIKGVNGPVNS